MNQIVWLFEFLVSLAVLSTVVLGAGVFMLRFLRQPIERVRCIQFSIAALVFAAVLQQTAMLPRIPIPVLPANQDVALRRNSNPSTQRTQVDSELIRMRKDFSSSDGAPAFAVDSHTQNVDVHPGSDTENTLNAASGDAGAAASVMHVSGPPASKTRSQKSESLGWLRIGMISVVAAWLLIAGVLGGQLLLGLWQLRSLRKKGQPIGSSKLRRWQHAREAQRCRVKIISSDEVAVPIAFGSLIPTIVLPTKVLNEDNEVRFFYCLSHEWAHVRSRDTVTWAFIQLLTPVLWFQPIFRRLQNELRIAQDQLADRFAAGEDSELADYAQLLKEMACDQLGISLRLAVSMSDARSSLYRRIECLLVPGFLLASKSRRWVAALVGIPMLVVAFLLGMARLDTWAVAEVPEERSSISTEQEGAPEPGEDDQLKYKSYSGSVTDSDGSPVSGAKIWLSRSFYKQNTDPKEFIRLEVAQTDSQGRFDFEIDQAVLRKFHSPAYGYSPSSNQLLAHLALIAEAPDRRVSGLPIMVFADGIKPSEMVGLQKQVDGTLGGGHFERRTIELPPSIGPVKAKLLDLDGEPITNVAVRLESIESTKIADLLAELEKRDTDATNLIRHERQFMFSSKLAAYLIARSQPAIVTNAQGEFELSGLGKDQLAALTLSSSKHEASRIMVLGRDMESKRIPNVSIYPNGAQDVFFGSQFTHVLGPSVPIAGTVTEYQSGKPIAGATVYVERLFREKGMSDNNRLRLSTEYIRTVSDENGRYTLRGLPPGGEHVIEVVPPASEPWLTSSNVVSPSVNEKMHLLDIQVYRGIWIEGSLTDGPSGEPLRGTVDYLALRSNTNTPRSVGLRQGWNHFAFPVDDSGHYRVVGLPGPGLVLARSVVGERKYPLAVGADEVEGYDPESRSLPTYRSLPVTNWNRIQQIDPPKGAESFSCDLTLTAGTSLAGRVVAPRKLEKLELEMLGLNDTQFWAQLKDDTFTVHNYEPDEPRRLFVRTKDHSLAGTLLVEGKSPDNLLVQLEPAVTVTGRLIDTSKDEPAAGYMIFCEKSTLGYFRIGTNNRSPTTDEDGRFTITGLLAGIEYSAMSANVQRFSSGKNNFQIDLSDAKPGANIELGDVTGPNSK